MATSVALETREARRMGDGRRILMFLTSLDDEGGAEVQVVQLAIRLHSRGWKVMVVSMLRPQSAEARLRSAGIPVFGLNMTPSVPDPRALLRLRRIVAGFKPHVMHAHMAHASLMARSLRLVARIPRLICTLHGARMYNTRGQGWALRELAHRFTDPLANRTTAVSREAAAHYTATGAVSQKRMFVVYNGIDCEKYNFDAGMRMMMRSELGLTGQFVWLAAGRLQQVKDFPTMLRAFALACDDRPDSLLLIAGDGVLKPELQQLASELHIESKVRFLGRRKDVPALMSAADGFLLTSVFEGLPLVLLEAAASKLPAVATNTGGNSEALVDGRTGYLAEVGNPASIAASMLRLCQQPQAELQEMQHAAREHARNNFEFSGIVRQWERVYEEVIAPQGAKR
ncbi:glycosyltransferase [Paludibaculum fermentans]|uniref:Glycosyltransferase n=1 Tax=Paludibaculum fermentans TaxID=1473598 RepID=A0A7S7NW25_PALFE|nr:glycosyltransferase [Paludibaculum fermentans]QOY90871.1 glycosyltransferase [Paludibaculum fermentans]